jgi:hypothetical protein
MTNNLTEQQRQQIEDRIAEDHAREEYYQTVEGMYDVGYLDSENGDHPQYNRDDYTQALASGDATQAAGIRSYLLGYVAYLNSVVKNLTPDVQS